MTKPVSIGREADVHPPMRDTYIGAAVYWQLIQHVALGARLSVDQTLEPEPAFHRIIELIR